LSNWCFGGPEGCKYNVSESGWMETPHFKEWFMTVFIENTKQIDGPKLLILDGHKSHINIDVLNEAKNNNIHIICLPPHTSHILQPLDLGVFKHVKTEWRKIVQNFYVKNGLTNIEKENFPSLLNTLTKISFYRRHAVGGFEITGIFPLNRHAISKEKLGNKII